PGTSCRLPPAGREYAVHQTTQRETAMARAIWKGAISFGLVTIPIRVHTAVEEKSFKFNQLHEKDQGRIKYKRTCAVDGEEVPFDEIVKGYEYEKDHYVVLTDDDIDRGLSNVRTIDILKFVDSSEIDPIYWQRSYYLAPDGTPGLKAYKLLSKALKDDDRVAVAKVAFRDKGHLEGARPYRGSEGVGGAVGEAFEEEGGEGCSEEESGCRLGVPELALS